MSLFYVLCGWAREGCRWPPSFFLATNSVWGGGCGSLPSSSATDSTQGGGLQPPPFPSCSKPRGGTVQPHLSLFFSFRGQQQHRRGSTEHPLLFMDNSKLRGGAVHPSLSSSFFYSRLSKGRGGKDTPLPPPLGELLNRRGAKLSLPYSLLLQAVAQEGAGRTRTRWGVGKGTGGERGRYSLSLSLSFYWLLLEGGARAP